jgi:glycosyltransferase involved in cell wall biosynthesis
MVDKPLVSVVIATYNMAAYVPLAVKSVLDQIYKNIEVIIIDDGSTDATREVVKPYLNDVRVRYLFFEQNKGQAVAKNYGVRESRGEYVAFLDGDDMWAPEKLDIQIPLFSKSEAIGVIYSRVLYIDERGKELRVADNELFRGRVSGPLLIRNFIGFGTCVIKRECFERLGGFREQVRMGIDYDLWLKFSTQYEFDYVDRPLLYYRLWAGQMSNNFKSRYLNGIEIMKNFLHEFPGAVDKNTENEAWAHTYVGFGQCVQAIDRQLGQALSLYLRAICHKPGYLPAWKAIIKAILNWEKCASP